MPLSGQVSLLIVEDDANLRYLLETAARRTGLFDPVVSAKDGQAALEILQTSAETDMPAMIVTDLSMPRMTGLELLRALKSELRTRSIPVAVITSSDLPNDRDLALEAGACSFVRKPYGLDALASALVAMRESCGEAAETAT